MAPVEADGGMESSAADPIRMSILNAVMEIAEYRSTYQGSSIDEAQRVLSGGLAARTGHAYAEAAEVISSLPALQLPPGSDRRAKMRVLLRELTLVKQPAWARLIPKGRGFLAAYLPRNAHQCLQAAGLYDELPDPAALEWWDALASHFRSATDLDRTRVGREGERLTMEHETARLSAAGRPDLKPKWVSLDDNSLGYDVLSSQLGEHGGEQPLHIEVKTSSVGSRQFFLTRNEWRLAESMRRSFAIYFWDLRMETLTILCADDLHHHIPVDRGDGQWQQALVSVPSVAVHRPG